MMQSIIDPRTGQPTTCYELGKDVGLPSYVIWYRWDSQGVRGLGLIAAKSAEIDLEAEQREGWQRFLRSPAGILARHRLGDYGRAKRQLRQVAA